MIIVSTQEVIKQAKIILSYQDFCNKIFGDEGLDIDENEDLAINANELTQDVYESLIGAFDTGLILFSLNGEYPGFITREVEDWSIFLPTQQNQPENQPVYDPNQNYTRQAQQNQQQSHAQVRDSVQKEFESDNFMNEPSDEMKDSIASLLQGASNDTNDYVDDEEEKGEAKVIVFGSSKGGTGKTFTSIISTYRYAQTHPDERIALIDFDIIDGQVGISIHRIKPTLAAYYVQYQKGHRDFNTLKNYSVKGNKFFPQNVDFYLAPQYGGSIDNNDFWFNIIQNAVENYDLVVFDTGIDYLNLVPISFAYKLADKINLVTSTSIKSVNSVTKQIGRLTGKIKSPGKDENGRKTDWVFTEKDGLASRVHVIITQMVQSDSMNQTVYGTLSKNAPVIATFGIITDSIQRAEYYGEWNVFEKNKSRDAFYESLDRIMEIK